MTQGIFAAGRLPTARALARCRAQYDVVKVAPHAVWIVDLSVDTKLNVPSVTNDADAVVASLFQLYGDRRFLYQDTMGNWDELVHDHGKFVTFKPARGEGPGAWAED